MVLTEFYYLLPRVAAGDIAHAHCTSSGCGKEEAHINWSMESNPTIEGGGDVTNLSPVEDGNDRKATPSGDRFDLITG